MGILDDYKVKTEAEFNRIYHSGFRGMVRKHPATAVFVAFGAGALATYIFVAAMRAFF